MTLRRIVSASIITLVYSSILCSQSSSISEAANNTSFDPRNLAGVWWVADPDTTHILERGRQGDASKCQTCHFSLHNGVPEPPLSPWAKDNLIIPDSVLNPMSMFSASQNTSQRNSCNPVGVPAQFWYAQFAPFEFVVTRNRIFQFFENRREWRVIWMDRDHPKNPTATYMGDSIAKWDGNTLIVDTVGFNGKDMIEPVGVNHLMSIEFHLLEHWRRVGNEKIELEATYFDPKAWGDKPWGGFNMGFVRQHNLQLAEGYCSLEDERNFQEKVIGPSNQPGRTLR